MSLAHVKRVTSEEKKAKTKRWIQEKVKRGNAYIPRREGMRKIVKAERKGLVVRYFQLMTGRAVIAPCLKNKHKKRDSEVCSWCGTGKRRTREHLFKEYEKWKEEIKELWRNVGRAKWKSIAQLFREEKVEKAVLEFI
jgi:hypothetical protein